MKTLIVLCSTPKMFSKSDAETLNVFFEGCRKLERDDDSRKFTDVYERAIKQASSEMATYYIPFSVNDWLDANEISKHVEHSRNSDYANRVNEVFKKLSSNFDSFIKHLEPAIPDSFKWLIDKAQLRKVEAALKTYSEVIDAHTKIKLELTSEYTKFLNDLFSKINIKGLKKPIRFEGVDDFNTSVNNNKFRLDISTATNSIKISMFIPNSGKDGYSNTIKVTSYALTNDIIEEVQSSIDKGLKVILGDSVKGTLDLITLKANDRKLTADELEFFAAFFAHSNLGQGGKITLTGSKAVMAGFNGGVTFDLTDLRSAANTFINKLGNLAESDDMYDDMMAEVKSWRKDLNGKTLLYIGNTWKDYIPICTYIATEGGTVKKSPILKIDNAIKPKHKATVKLSTEDKEKPKSKYAAKSRVVVKFDDDDWYLGTVAKTVNGKVSIKFDDDDSHAFAENSPKIKLVSDDIKKRKKFLTNEQALGLAKKALK